MSPLFEESDDRKADALLTLQAAVLGAMKAGMSAHVVAQAVARELTINEGTAGCSPS